MQAKAREAIDNEDPLKPKFLTKAEREAEAIKKREAQVELQKQKE